MYKLTSRKYNSDAFPIYCGFLVVFVCVAWFGDSLLSTDNPYPFVIVVDRTPCAGFKCKNHNISEWSPNILSQCCVTILRGDDKSASIQDILYEDRLPVDADAYGYFASVRCIAKVK